MSRRPWHPLAVGALIGAVTLLLLVGLLATGGFDVGAALSALVRGAVGSPSAFVSGTLVRATPLLLAGLAVAVAFEAGVLNIGAEGQLLAGATATTAVALALPLGALTLPVALAAGALAGAAWAAVAAMLRQRFGVLEVISAIMLNFVAQFAVAWLVRGPLQESTHIYPQSSTLPLIAQLPVLVPGTRLHWGFALAVVAAIAIWFVIRHTATGFRLRTVGANPFAAASAGRIDAIRIAFGAFVVSGALAGLAGAVEVSGVTYALYENLSPGYGYSAIAVALLARLDARLIVASAVLFGGLEAGGVAMQRDAAVPSVVVSVVEATLILMVLSAGRLRGRSWQGGDGGAAAITADPATLVASR